MTEFVRLRVTKSSTSVLINETLICRLVVCFEASSVEELRIVSDKLNGMTILTGATLNDEAVDLLKNDVEELQRAKDVLIREHKAEIEQLLQTQSFQTREINRLKRLEDTLDKLATTAMLVNPKVVR